MNHRGELFLSSFSSSEEPYPLGKVLRCTTGPSGQTDPTILTAIDEAIFDHVGKVVGVYLDENYQGLYSSGRGDYLQRQIRSEFINYFISKIKSGITDALEKRNVVHFEILTPDQSAS